jgi:outer membrane protein OmpA-like peptidoglycan-associated protein
MIYIFFGFGNQTVLASAWRASAQIRTPESGTDPAGGTAMTRRILFSLALIATLTLTAVAQQSAAPAEQPPAAQTSADSSSPTVNPDRQLEPLQPPAKEGFWGRLNPFARKKYVEKQVAPVRERANELDELTAANARYLKDVDTRATAGIQRADAHANLADEHAVEAGNRAQAAGESAQQANTRLTKVSETVDNLDKYQASTQVEIHFRRNTTTLSPNAKDALDQLAQSMKGERGCLLEVQGFTSGRGNAAIQHSQKLADSVVRYLVINHEIPVYRIYKLGLGNAQLQSDSGEAVHGNVVQVTLMRNSVGDLQASQQPPSMAQPQ